MAQTTKIRILCNGWYDTESGRSYAAGSIVSGDRISSRLRMALESGETYRDRSGRELPVCEDAEPVYRGLPIIKEPVLVESLPDQEEKLEIKFMDSDQPEMLLPIRILEARMSVEGVKVVDLGIRKAGNGNER